MSGHSLVNQEGTLTKTMSLGAIDIQNDRKFMSKQYTIYVVLFFVIILIFNSKAIGFVPNNLFYCDQNTQQIKVLFLITILLTLPFIKQSLIIQKINYIEFDILLLLSTLASLLLISASDLLAVYVLIEMQSLCFYILASFKRNSVFSISSVVSLG
jgi:NADH:ubiquinone oxidoreductase subunit 2 (subunit N)